ncbi:MAG TPA: hypothetical protein VMO47_10520 [Rhodothermales bacterium]|nr:hypothetical protein [Rhodothermales bacterium]
MADRNGLSDVDRMVDEMSAAAFREVNPEEPVRTSTQVKGPDHGVNALFAWKPEHIYEDHASELGKAFRSWMMLDVFAAAVANDLQFGRDYVDNYTQSLPKFLEDLLEPCGDDPIEKMLVSQVYWSHVQIGNLLAKANNYKGAEWSLKHHGEAGRVANISRRQIETLTRYRESKRPKESAPDVQHIVNIAVTAVLQLVSEKKSSNGNELGNGTVIDVEKLSAQLTRAALSAGGDPESAAVAQLDRAKNGGREESFSEESRGSSKNRAKNAGGEAQKQPQRPKARAPKPRVSRGNPKRKGSTSRRKGGAQ